jgi:hypothetical protein
MPGWREKNYEYGKKELAEKDKTIQESSDPYQIMSIFIGDHSDFPFSSRLDDHIVKRMIDLIRQDKTPDNMHGIQAIRAVLDTLRNKIYDQRTQHVGFSILEGAAQRPKPNERRDAFVFMMDEITVVIETAQRRNSESALHSSPLYEVENKISMIREKQTAQTAMLARKTACCAACANKQRYTRGR